MNVYEVISKVEQEIKSCDERMNMGQGALMRCGEKYGETVVLCSTCKGKESVLKKLRSL